MKLFVEPNVRLGRFKIMDMCKSEVIWDISRLIRLKVIIYDDLSEFSEELQQEVKRIIEMSR